MEFLGWPKAARYALVAFALTFSTVRAAGPITLSVSGRANANVSIASDGSFVALVWSASRESGTTDVYLAVSHDSGTKFSAPVRVNSTPGDARTNGEQPPRVSLVPREGKLPEIAVLWTTRRGPTTMLLTGRSSDGGSTFGRSAVVPGTNAVGNRGWQAIGASASGAVYGVWLDHRRLAEHQQEGQATAHQHGGMDPQLSQLYFSRLDGRSDPIPLTGGVCYCCKTAMAMGRGGEINLAWRHVYPGNLRDMAFTVSRDGGRSFGAPVRISEDKWAIEGCPEDGPSLAVDRENRVHAVWTTVVVENREPVKALFHAVAGDGRTFGPRNRLPTEGQTNHPQMAIGRDGVVTVVWDELSGGRRKLAVARGSSDSSAQVRFRRDSAGERIGTYPAVGSTDNGAVLAWTSGEPSSSIVYAEQLK